MEYWSVGVLECFAPLLHYSITPLLHRFGPMPDARRIADILSELESRRGYARTKSSESLAEAWLATAGEPTASHSRVGEVRRGTLEVIVANSMLAQELQFEKQRLLTQLIERLPDHKLRDLRFRVGAVK
jgi:predicted nucleic acid-binding Zn ribbon protein